MNQINIDIFFKNISRPVRPLNQGQVDGILQILNFYNEDNYGMNEDELGSYLGQVGTETAFKYKPIREFGPKSYFKYLIGKLGIRNLEEAYMFRGWGRLQTTGVSNFARAVDVINRVWKCTMFTDANDFANWLLTHAGEPSESNYDLVVTFECFTKGLYTGKKISDYRGEIEFDFRAARRVVNPGQVNIANKKPYGSHASMLNQIVADSKEFARALKIASNKG